MAINVNIRFSAKAAFGRVTSEIKRLTGSIAASQQGMAAATKGNAQEMKRMQQQMAGAVNMTQQFNAQTARMAAPVDQLANSIRRGDVNLRQLRESMRNNATITKQQVALQRGWIGSLETTANGMTQMEFRTQRLSDVQTTLRQRMGTAAASTHAFSNRVINMGKNMQWAGRQIMVGLTVPLGFFVVKAVKAAEEYDRAMTRVIKVTNFAASEGTAAFAAEEEALRGQIRTLAQLGTQMGFTSGQTADAAAEFAQMGYQAQSLNHLVEAAQKLSYTSGTTMENAINLTRVTAQAFNIELQNLTGTFARLNMIENNTALSLDEMAQSLPVVASVANQLGLAVEETAGLMAMMKDAGISAREGATALRTGLIRIVQEATDPAIEAFERIGLSLTDLQARHKGDTLGFFDELGSHLQNIQDQGQRADFTAAIGKLVGTRQAARFIAFLEEVPNRMEEGTAGFRAWSGASADAAEAFRIFNFEQRRVQESAAGQAEILRAEMSTLMEEIGQPLLEFMNVLRGFAVSILEWFTNLSSTTQTWIKRVLAITAITGPLLMLVGILQNFLGQVLRASSGLVVWASRTRFVSSEQAMLDAMLKKRILTQEAYNASMGRTIALENANARAAGQAATFRGMPVALQGINVGRGAASAIDPRRFGAKGGLMAGAGLGALVSLTSELVQGTEDWQGALTKVGIAGLTLGPMFKGFVSNFKNVGSAASGLVGIIHRVGMAIKLALGPIGLVLAAVTAVGTAFWAWRKNIRESYEEMPKVSDEAEKIAKQMGLVWSKSEGFDDSLKSVEQRMAETRTENAALVNEINELDDAGKTSRIREIGMEMIWAGNDPEQVAEQLTVWADEMDIEIPVDLNVKFFEETVHIKERAVQFGKEFREAVQEGIDLPGLQNIERSMIAEEARHVLDLIGTGDAQYIHDAGNTIRQTLEQIASSTDSLVTRRDAVKHFFETLEEGGLDMADLPSFGFGWFGGRENFNEFINQTLAGGTAINRMGDQALLTASGTRAIIAGLMKANRLTLQQMVNDAKATIRALEEEILSSPFVSDSALQRLVSAKKHLTDLEDEVGKVDDAQRQLDEGAEEGFGGVEEEASKAKDAVSRLRSSVGDIISRVGSMAGEILAERHAAEQEMWSNRLDALREAQSDELELLRENQQAQLDEIESRYDSEIEALEDVEEKENELERQRQHAFRMQKRRDDYLSGRAQGAINLRAAIARGDLDEAARIRQTMSADQTDYQRDIAEEETKFQEDTRKRQRDAAIDAFEEQKDAALEAAKVEHDAQEKLLKQTQKTREEQVRAAADAAKKQNDIVKRQLDHQLQLWQNTTPRTEAEYREHLGRLGEIMKRFGVGDLSSIASGYENIFGTSIHNGFKEGVDLATVALAEDRRWEEAGDLIGQQIIAGLLGQEYTPPVRRAAPGTAWNRARPGGAQEYHSGGRVNSSSAGPGLKPGEQKAVLQTGEYVMDRKTVSRYGPDFFEGLQRFHEGGLVDHLADLSPLMAMSHTLGQVLGGRPIQDTGNLGAAIHQKIQGDESLLGGAQWQPGGAWPPRRLRQLSANTAAAQSFIKNRWAVPHGVAASLNRQNLSSDHPWGKALDVMVSRLGTFASGASKLMGDNIAEWFTRNPGQYGTSYVIWDGKINTGTGWRRYSSSRYDTSSPTGGHYDHVHISYLHNGGLVGRDGKMSIPALRAGADVNYDNTLANLHRGERVLTSPLTEKLDMGLDQLANGGGNVYDIDINVQGNVDDRNVKALARQVRLEIEKTNTRTGRSRRIE